MKSKTTVYLSKDSKAKLDNLYLSFLKDGKKRSKGDIIGAVLEFYYHHKVR